MILTRELDDGEVRVEVSGALNGEMAVEFQELLETLAEGNATVVTLDLSNVPAINSACIGKILLHRRRLTEAKRSVRIDGCSEPLFNTFRLIKFDRLVPIERDT